MDSFSLLLFILTSIYVCTIKNSEAGLLDIITGGGNNDHQLGRALQPSFQLFHNNNNDNNNRYRPQQTGNDNAYTGMRDQGKEMTDKEKLQNLLDRLNKLQELQKQKQQNNGINNNQGVSKPVIDNDGSVIGTNNVNGNNNIKPNGNSNIKPNENNPNVNSNMNGNDKTDHVWKALRKRKILFQAQPVIPENEMKSNIQTIYYLD